MKYTAEQRKQISEQVQGKRIESLEYQDEADFGDGGGSYWTMTFEDGSEISFRLMAELVN